MIGGLIKSNRVAALAGAGFIASALAVSPAQAADLGGDCCADLEERVATLEATTARKGNRKVSLTISGWVNQALYIWDDGTDSDAYVVSDNGITLGSRITFAGNAKINSNWSAGYDITLEVLTADNNLTGLNQNTDDADNLRIFYSNLYVKSEQLGKVTIGQQSQASDNITVVDLSGSIFSGIPPIFEGGTFLLRDQTVAGNPLLTGRTWSGNLNCLGIGLDCNGDAKNVIRYDAPTIAGFSLSASWGEDDFWDVALRYAGQFGDFKVAAAIAYAEDQEQTAGALDTETLEGGVSVMHVPTGIFANLALGKFENAAGNESESYLIKAGIKQKWNSLGATAIYGEYGVYDDNVLGLVDTDGDGTADNLDGLAGSSAEVTRYGVGIHQWIDAAAMQVYAKWDHVEVDSNAAEIDGNELDSVTLGAVIFF